MNEGEKEERIGMIEQKIEEKKRKINILIEYKYVYPSTDKYRMNIGDEEQKRRGDQRGL